MVEGGDCCEEIKQDNRTARRVAALRTVIGNGISEKTTCELRSDTF